MHADGVVSEAELARARNEAEQRRSEAAGLGIARDRLASERTRDEADRAAALRDADRRMASLEGDLAAQEAIVRRLEEESRWRSIRAPFAGQIGELARLEAGALIQPGRHLGTIVPVRRLEVLGGFPPATALGRIRPGQRAEVRLDAFPWTEFGALPARVERVSSELREGRIWVELTLEPGPASRASPSSTACQARCWSRPNAFRRPGSSSALWARRYCLQRRTAPDRRGRATPSRTPAPGS